MNGVPVANMLISVFNNTVDVNIEFTNAVSSSIAIQIIIILIHFFFCTACMCKGFAIGVPIA